MQGKIAADEEGMRRSGLHFGHEKKKTGLCNYFTPAIPTKTRFDLETRLHQGIPKKTPTVTRQILGRERIVIWGLREV